MFKEVAAACGGEGFEGGSGRLQRARKGATSGLAQICFELGATFPAGTPVAAAPLGLDAAGRLLEFAVTFGTALGELEKPGDLRRTLPTRAL